MTLLCMIPHIDLETVHLNIPLLYRLESPELLFYDQIFF